MQAASGYGSEIPPTAAPVQFLAGGTTILDLMKLDVMRPERLVDINQIERTGNRIHLVNGVSIVQCEAVERVAYFHVELDSHDVIVTGGRTSACFDLLS